MAVTCKWNFNLGYGTKSYELEDGTKRVERITLYGGGNSLFAACFESKNLYAFAFDKEHFKRCFEADKDFLELDNLTLTINDDKHVQKEVKILAKLFIDLGVPFTYQRKED